MTSYVAFAPAKINLFLAITERRPDNFHNLVSIAAPLEFGDTLWFDPDEQNKGQGSSIRLTCSEPGLPLDDSNLILKASSAFITATGWQGGGVFHLLKRIPVGAGLGGGSSDASAALQLLNASAGHPLAHAELLSLASTIGSDCALFLKGAPVLMRGRGNLLEPLPISAIGRISRRRVLVFKPWFGISTPWAYQQMAAKAPSSYLAPGLAEERVSAWINAQFRPLEDLLFNNMETPAFRKYIGIRALLDILKRDHNLAPRMSGSGSACFALLPDGLDARPIVDSIKSAWGPESFIIETRFA